MDPVFSLDEVFPVEPPYGAQMDWFLYEKPQKQAVQMDKVMTKHHSHYWACFTGEMRY